MSIPLLVVVFLALALSGRQLLATPKGRPLGYGMLGVALVLFLLIFGYGVGKDLAHWDSAHLSSSGSHRT